ncbi:MAG TPA: hypothetical protein VGN85_01910 [Methyloceanibacter sp.]|nr:hypothetical protein [Methyloceanibacter sp.]
MKKKTPPGSADLIVSSDPASTKYVNDLVEQGKSARAGADGALPPGATHEIVGETEIGVPILRRRRFG